VLRTSDINSVMENNYVNHKVELLHDVNTEITSSIKAKLEWSLDKLELDEIESRKCIRSPAFTVPVCGVGTEWFISIYPKGTAIHGRGEQATYIHLHHSPPNGYRGSDAEYSMSFRTDTGYWPEDHQSCRKGIRTTEEWRKGGYGYMKMCSYDDLTHMYVDDLSVTSVGDSMSSVTVMVKRKLVIAIWLKIAVPVEDIKRCDEFINDIQSMLEMKNFSDVVLRCGGKDFQCHKVILSARSDVLKTMLEQDMKEANENVIEVVDTTPDIVSLLIDHIYTGRVPESSKMKLLAPEILHIAVKYNLPSLISICEDTMLSELNCNNAIKTFIYIDRYSPASKLREQVLKFLCRNAADLVGEGDWSDFIRQYPELATEMFKNYINISGNSNCQPNQTKKLKIG